MDTLSLDDLFSRSENAPVVSSSARGSGRGEDVLKPGFFGHFVREEGGVMPSMEEPNMGRDLPFATLPPQWEVRRGKVERWKDGRKTS